MSSFDAAHLDIMDVPVVLVFVDQRPAGLAPSESHAFFRVAGYDQLRAQINTNFAVRSKPARKRNCDLQRKIVGLLQRYLHFATDRE